MPNEDWEYIEEVYDIPIDDYIVDIPDYVHRPLHPKWNDEWDTWFKENPNATGEDAGGFASELIEIFKLGNFIEF
jgi:hypothetical protein